MAYIVNQTRTDTANAATYTVNLGTHQTNDLLLVFLAQDVGGTTITTASSGWSILSQVRSGTSVRGAIAYKVAASGAEASPVFSGATDDWIGDCVVVRDADPTTPFGSSPASGTDYVTSTSSTGQTHAMGTITTAVNDCLLMWHVAQDTASANTHGRAALNDCRGLVKNNDTAIITQTVGYAQQPSTGSKVVSSITMYKTATAAAAGHLIAIRNKTGGALQPDIRPNSTPLYYYGNHGTAAGESITWAAPSSFAASIGTYLGSAINCSASAPSTNTQNIISPEQGWGSFTNISSSENVSSAGTNLEAATGVGGWVGGVQTVSLNLTGKIFAVNFARNTAPVDSFSQREGLIVGFSDGTNWVAYQVQYKPNGWAASFGYAGVIALGNATPFASSGSVSSALSGCTKIAYLHHRGAAGTTAYGHWMRNAVLFDATTPVQLVGGGASRPATLADVAQALQSWGDFDFSTLQATAQTLVKLPVQIGDGGTTTTYFDASASATEFPAAWVKTQDRYIRSNFGTAALLLNVKAGASDTVKLGSSSLVSDVQQTFSLDAATSTSATYGWTGLSMVGFAPTWKTGIAATGIAFGRCAPISFNGADVTDCTIRTTTASSSQAAATWDTSGATVTRTTIDVTGTSAGYHIELGASVTSITLTDVTFTGTPGTDKIHVKATTGTVTITIDGTTSLAAGDVTSDGATVSIVAPTLERGLEFTGLVAGSKVKVFSTGTDTERFSTASSGTTETWDDATAGSVTVDYVILKAGYEPIRVTGVTVTGAVGTGVQTVPVAQVVARWYQAASGLTINTNAFANATTKQFGLTTTSTLQNFASYLLEQWITLGDTGEAYANKAWPLQANGPNSFTWLDGWTADLTTYPNTIANFSRDGMRYLNASGNVTAMWAAILSVGVPSGARVRFQQVEGTTQSAAVTSGNMDELIQILSDPNGDGSYADGYDRRGYLVLKVQESGYDEATANAITLYGNLEDQLYVVGLAPTANGVATGSPGAVTATITDHGASPVTWHGAAYSITIQSDASGETIMRWLRYNFETGGTFQGTDAFNWHNLVQVNGDAFKTIRGTIYGDTGASLKGVRVITSGGADHPDFTLYTADDGSTYAPVIPANASATVLAGSRVQLYNVTTATEIENIVEATTSYSYTITTEASVGDVLRLRVCKLGYEPEEVTGVWSASGLTFLVTQSSDDIYTAWGIDGSTVTEFTLDVTGNIEIDANDVDGATTKTRLGAWFNYALTTADGIRSAFGAISALATNAIRINVDVVDLTIENVNATTALRLTDTDVRLYRSDGTTIIAATSYSIHNDYSGVPDVVETGVSGLTGSESAQLMGLPSATATAAAVWAHTLP